MNAIVFLGPTLPRCEAVSICDCVYLPPARQGDVYRAVHEYRPSAIGLIDGVFLHVPAVWHRELLWALSQGVHLFGAASMGALRAVELEPFGMRGVGCVCAAYRSGRWPGFDEPFEDDDEVAVIHAPPEAGSTPLSDAMVDLRETLLAAERDGVLHAAERIHLAATMKTLHFSQRSFDHLNVVAPGILDRTAVVAFRTWLHTNRVSRKRLDAIEMLQMVADFLHGHPDPFKPAFRFERALVWERFTTAADMLEGNAIELLDELRLDPRTWHATERAALGRMQALRAASDPADEALARREFDRFRLDRGLWRSADLTAWLIDNDLGGGELERLMAEEAVLAVTARSNHDAVRSTMIDLLRLSGQFSTLLKRVQAKQSMLHDKAAASTSPGEPSLHDALDWYFDRQRLPPPQSMQEYAEAAGWRSVSEFKLAVWHDYLFETVGR
jgi:hypothetical protein